VIALVRAVSSGNGQWLRLSAAQEGYVKSTPSRNLGESRRFYPDGPSEARVIVE